MDHNFSTGAYVRYKPNGRRYKVVYADPLITALPKTPRYITLQDDTPGGLKELMNVPVDLAEQMLERVKPVVTGPVTADQPGHIEKDPLEID